MRGACAVRIPLDLTAGPWQIKGAWAGDERRPVRLGRAPLVSALRTAGGCQQVHAAARRRVLLRSGGVQPGASRNRRTKSLAKLYSC